MELNITREFWDHMRAEAARAGDVCQFCGEACCTCGPAPEPQEEPTMATSNTRVEELIGQARAREQARQEEHKRVMQAQEEQRRREAMTGFEDILRYNFGRTIVDDLGLQLDYLLNPRGAQPKQPIAIFELDKGTFTLWVNERHQWALGRPDDWQRFGPAVELNNRDQEPQFVQQRYDQLLLKLGQVLEAIDADNLPF